MNTKARKLQLNQVKRNNLSINDYALKIKSIIEALGSIKVTVDDDDVVRACLDGLGDDYVHFRSSMNTRDDIPEFTVLISMLILRRRTLVLTHLLLKAKISLNRPSILTPTEVEVVVAAAKVVAGANLEKVNQIRAIQVAGETSLEVGGVKEVEV